MKVMIELDQIERFWLYDLIRDTDKRWEDLPPEVRTFYSELLEVLN